MRLRSAKGKIGFFVFKNIHIPHHLREYYVGLELIKSGWQIEWLLPISGKESDDLQIDWPIVRYRECNFKGQKAIFPLYFAYFLIFQKIDTLWISGWAIRDPDALNWLVKILKIFKIKIVYDTVDPIDIFYDAHFQDQKKALTIRTLMNSVYRNCDLILTVTPEIKEKIELSDIDARKIFSHRWGTDTSLFKPDNIQRDFRKEIGVNADIFLVGWLGSMNPFKGLLEIIVPLIENLSKEEEKIHFILAGYGILEKELRSWAEARPDCPVTILGKIPYHDAPSFTGCLDAYLVPTNPDSDFGQAICPVKCFDSLAMNVDVLVTKTKATLFLKDLSERIHLCDFKVESYMSELRKILAKVEQKNKKINVTTVSHQGIAKDIVQTICTTL